MLQYDNRENENSISFSEFSIKLNGVTEIENLNIDLGWDCDVLLYSRNRNISRITGLFVFDIFNNMEPGGKLMHGGGDIVELITKIKKFRVNGNRIGILGRLLGDIFSIPPDPLDTFDPGIKISSQILDFVPYQTRIEALNAIIRREMIKLVEIREIIKNFDDAKDKLTYTIIKSQDFGVLPRYTEMYNILNSGSGDRENLLASLMIGEKTGVNLADMVMLRDYYRYRLTLDGVNGEICECNVKGKSCHKIHKKRKSIMKNGKKDFNFMNFKVAKSYSENILKIEIINLVKSYMNITGIRYEEGIYDIFPTDAKILDLYKLLTCLAFLTGKSIIIADITLNPEHATEIVEFIKRLKSIQNMACLYICTDDEVAGNKNRIFDRVIKA